MEEIGGKGGVLVSNKNNCEQNDRNDADFLDEMEQESRKDKTPEEMSDKELEERFEIMLDDLSATGLLKLVDSNTRRLDYFFQKELKKLIIKFFDLGNKEDALNEFRKGSFDE